MSEFESVVEAAEQVPIEGWDFGRLDGRAVKERPTWRYFDRVAERAPDVSTLLEVQAGVGSMIGRLPTASEAVEALAAAYDDVPLPDQHPGHVEFTARSNS